MRNQVAMSAVYRRDALPLTALPLRHWRLYAGVQLFGRHSLHPLPNCLRPVRFAGYECYTYNSSRERIYPEIDGKWRFFKNGYFCLFLKEKLKIIIKNFTLLQFLMDGHASPFLSTPMVTSVTLVMWGTLQKKNNANL